MKTTLFVLLTLSCSAQSWADNALKEKVDEIFNSTSNAPGCAVGVIHDGRFLIEAGYGMANLEHGIRITPSSVFRVGSLSKQFVATAVALLAQQKKLNLDDDIHEYLPELNDYGTPVTIRQIVHHISGMGDYDDAAFKKENGQHFRFGNRDFWTISEFHERVDRTTLVHPPETRWQYSNIGYVNLARVIERVSGVSASEYIKQNILIPLGMSSSFFNDNVNQLVINRANGYKVSETKVENYMTNLSWVGDGGLYTTLDDFIRWDQNFYSPVLEGGAELISVINTPHPLAKAELSGVSGLYAFGQLQANFQGADSYLHSGHWVGYSSFYVRNPELKLSTVVFCNGSNYDAPIVAARVDALAKELVN